MHVVFATAKNNIIAFCIHLKQPSQPTAGLNTNLKPTHGGRFFFSSLNTLLSGS